MSDPYKLQATSKHRYGYAQCWHYLSCILNLQHWKHHEMQLGILCVLVGWKCTILNTLSTGWPSLSGLFCCWENDSKVFVIKLFWLFIVTTDLFNLYLFFFSFIVSSKAICFQLTLSCRTLKIFFPRHMVSDLKIWPAVIFSFSRSVMPFLSFCFCWIFY